MNQTWIRTIALVGWGLAILLCGCESAGEKRSGGDSAYDATYAYSYRSLYERLGEEAAITKVVDDTLARAQVNPQLHAKLEGANVPLLRTRLIELICAITGGPQEYGGQDMKTAHAGMGITDAEFDALAEDMLRAMVKLGVGKRERRELLAMVAATRPDIVASRTASADVLARLEARLENVERLLRERGGVPAPYAAAPASAAPSTATPVAAAGTAPAPVTAAAPGKPIISRAWLPEEKDWALKNLISRYSKGRGGKSEKRGDLVGSRLDPSRMLSDKGRVLDLDDFKGKKVVLVILRGFKGQVCLHCSSQTLALTDQAAEFTKRDSQVILVYPGAAESVPVFLDAIRALRADFEPPFPIALDVDMRLVNNLNIKGTLAKPTSLVLDGEGVVRYAHVGDVPANRPTVEELQQVDRLP